MPAYVALENVMDLDDLKGVLENHGPAIMAAVNDAGRWAYYEAHKQISKDLNWPAGYINQQRLKFWPARGNFKFGGGGAAVVTARSRPTTLTRFNAMSVKGPDGKPSGVRVEVSRGKSKVIKNAFMRTINGNALVMMRDYHYRELPNVNANKYVWNGLVTLYGPSVDQAFKTHRDGKDGIAAHALEKLEEDIQKLWGGK